MKIIYTISDLPKKYRYIFTVGNFDGFHRGHQRLLREVVKQKKKPDEKTLVITFVSHPKDDGDYRYLTDSATARKFFTLCNIDYVLKLEFGKVKHCEYQEFLRWLCENIHIKTMVLTQKLRIGHNRKGTSQKIIKTLHDLNKDIHVKLVPLLEADGKPVSTTEIKKLINAGNVDRASNLLGYRYGAVKSGVSPMGKPFISGQKSL